MNIQAKSSAAVASRKLPFEVVALVLQGGGALAAYQAGVFETLAEAGTAELDSQAFPSEPSTLRSLEIHRCQAWIDCENSGRRLRRTRRDVGATSAYQRSMVRAWRVFAHDVRCCDAGKGNRVFQPDPDGHGPA